MILKKGFGIDAGVKAHIYYEALEMWNKSEVYNKQFRDFMSGLFPDVKDDSELVITSEMIKRIADTAEDDVNGYPFVDYVYEFRSYGEHTELDIGNFTSSHYDSERVAYTLSDGIAISWIYWYGGGKHGQPESIDWMSEKYGAMFVGYKDVSVIQRFYHNL